MVRSFQAKAAFVGLFSCVFALPSLASDLCQVRDEKSEKAAFAALDAFYDQALKEHSAQAVSRSLVPQAKARARAVLEQRIFDKKTELCADRLKLAQDIKAAPSRWETADCAAAATVGLTETYMVKVAQAHEDNRNALAAHHRDHLNELKKRMLAVARSPQAPGLEGIKQLATKLAAEAHRAWGASLPGQHPLVQENLSIAREAVRVRSERDSLKARFGTGEKMPESCKPKTP